MNVLRTLARCGPSLLVLGSACSTSSRSDLEVTATSSDTTWEGSTSGDIPTSTSISSSLSTSTTPLADSTQGDDASSTDSPPPGTDGTETGDPAVFDCNEVPDTFGSTRLLDGARGYHGLAITPDGFMLGSDGSSLLGANAQGVQRVLVPGLGEGQQMDWLADGDLAHATDGGAITRVRLDGTTQVITPSVFAYGVTRGPDDMLYVAPMTATGEGNVVLRIDPSSGETQPWLDLSSESEAHSLGFSPDGRRVYVGTIGNGVVYYADLDASTNPTTPPMVLSDEVGVDNNGTFDGWHDAVAVDACGYLYVPDFHTFSLFRIAPDGTTTLYGTPESLQFYGHATVWGTGTHGWRSDALYLALPYQSNMVAELVVGVPSPDFEGTVLNPPAQR